MKNTVSLTENHVFRATYRHGKQYVCKSFAVYVMKDRRGSAVNQLGITVSVKLGCAVLRNRCKRRLKEAFRTLEARLKTGYDIVLVARSATLNVEFEKLAAEMEKAFSQTGLL